MSWLDSKTDDELFPDMKAARRAGQASTEQIMKWQDDLIQELQAKCAELERDLKMTDEFRIKALNDLATIKAQAGEPITENTSDGYHTFKELYECRHALFVALLRSNPSISWRANNNYDGTHYEGWFVAGMHLPSGDISFHIPVSYWEMLDGCLIATTNCAPPFDGHNTADVIKRLLTPIRPTTEPVKAQAGELDADIKRHLVQIHSALCSKLGDTDPYFPDDMTDEEIREANPVFWSAKEIAALVGDAPWDQFTHPTNEPVKAQAGEPVMPAYGQIPWKDLIASVGEAQGCAWEPDDSYYIGHQPVSINMNSLNRIVSKFAAPATTTKGEER